MTDRPKKFKVYHSKNWTLNTLLHFQQEGFNPHRDDYEHVANVHVLALGDTFQFTNHIDKPWTEHLNVEALKENPRSTSVGDVVVDESGKVWLCASVGWEEVKWNTDLKSNDVWWMRNAKRYQDLDVRS